MLRVKIHGSSGSGKSTLAIELGEILDLPVIHLDDVFWLPNWQMPEQEEYLSKVAQEITEDKWVMDGNYSRVRSIVFPKVTYAIILNLPLRIALWRIFLRTLSRNLPFINVKTTPLPKSIEQSGDGEKIFSSIFTLWKQAIRFKIKRYPEIIQVSKKYLGEDYIILNNQKEVYQFIQKIKKMKSQE